MILMVPPSIGGFGRSRPGAYFKRAENPVLRANLRRDAAGGPKSAVTHAIRDPLLNVALTTNTLAAITGSSSGGLSIALAAGQTYLATARTLGIPPEVLHRVPAMASGGMDTLPHNGAVITLLAITGLTHRQSYGDIFAMTGTKVAAVFVAIGFYRLLNQY